MSEKERKRNRKRMKEKGKAQREQRARDAMATPKRCDEMRCDAKRMPTSTHHQYSGQHTVSSWSFLILHPHAEGKALFLCLSLSISLSLSLSLFPYLSLHMQWPLLSDAMSHDAMRNECQHGFGARIYCRRYTLLVSPLC